jgi:5-methyltetrahydrofolate corrinoid/iron sulfur protein methyltransferase
MDYIDINLGPAKKDGHELMPWVVETFRKWWTDVPLALDTSNIDAIEAALKVIKQVPRHPHIVNSIMAGRSATSAWCPWQPNTVPISSP